VQHLRGGRRERHGGRTIGELLKRLAPVIKVGGNGREGDSEEALELKLIISKCIHLLFPILLAFGDPYRPGPASGCPGMPSSSAPGRPPCR
jgi:hypothetical protein